MALVMYKPVQRLNRVTIDQTARNIQKQLDQLTDQPSKKPLIQKMGRKEFHIFSRCIPSGQNLYTRTLVEEADYVVPSVAEKFSPEPVVENLSNTHLLISKYMQLIHHYKLVFVKGRTGKEQFCFLRPDGIKVVLTKEDVVKINRFLRCIL